MLCLPGSCLPGVFSWDISHASSKNCKKTLTCVIRWIVFWPDITEMVEWALKTPMTYRPSLPPLLLLLTTPPQKKKKKIIMKNFTWSSWLKALQTAAAVWVSLESLTFGPISQGFRWFKGKEKSRFRETHTRSAKKTCWYNQKSCQKVFFFGSRLHQIDF